MKKFNSGTAVATAVALFVLGFGPLAAFAAGPAAVNLGAAGNFVILAKTGISTTGSTVVVGDIGVSPAPASYITGFALTLPAASAFSTSAEVSGKVYAPDYASPTPANITTAVGDMQTAYTDAAGRTNPTATELGAGNIGGLTLAPGLYKWGTGVTIPADVTLSGGANDVWIFQIAQTLTVSSAVKVTLSGGAQANNVFWVVAGQTTIGTGAVFNGTVLDQTAVVLNTGAQLNGRALAQTAVTLDSNSVAMSTSAASTPAPIPAPIYTPTPTPTATQTQTQTGTNTQTTTGASAATSNGVSAFAKDFWMGTSNAGVQALQQYLNAHSYTVAASGPGSVGNETMYFGPLTKAALIKFQSANGINPAAGYFGSVTRSYINTH